MNKILTLIFFSTLALLFPATARCQDTVGDLNQKILEYTQKLEELTKSKDTLANQISILNSQIQLTLLKIDQAKSNISLLQQDIADLTVKINDLDLSLNRLSSQYIEQVSQNYKLSKRYPQISLFTTLSFNNFLEQFKYLTVLQKNSQNTLVDMETIRTNYDLQKEQKKVKQQQLEELEKVLASQQASLGKQKASKTNLLEITKNDEKKYQQLKKAAEDELNSLLRAKFVGKRDVKAGEPIGMMGNTGYSFGDHLHFGLYNLKENELNSWSYANDIDPMDYINQHMWPMNDPINITQSRGQTQYSYLYSDHFHHGIDMVSPNKAVRSISDGVAYFFRDPSSSLGNHVKVFHSDGKMTLYLHLQ